MSSLQALVVEFNKKYERRLAPAVRCLDLASEVGEVSKLAFSESTGMEVTTGEWQEELGDTLYTLLSLFTELNLEAETSLEIVLEKYKRRVHSKGRMDSSDKSLNQVD